MKQLLLGALRRMHIFAPPPAPRVEPDALPIEDDGDDWADEDDDALVGPLLLLYGEWDDVDIEPDEDDDDSEDWS